MVTQDLIIKPKLVSEYPNLPWNYSIKSYFVDYK